VVIKQIPVDDLDKEERFSAMNEVKVLSMFKHPNIIAYYENFVEEKSLWIVMEYAPGETLHRFIEERNSQLMDEDVRNYTKNYILKFTSWVSVYEWLEYFFVLAYSGKLSKNSFVLQSIEGKKKK